MSNKFLRNDGTFQQVDATALSITNLTASTTAAIALNNVSAYFDGPSVSQGSSGIWYVSGTVSISNPSNVCTLAAELWDGTTVIASCDGAISVANRPTSLSLSGSITNPAGNLRISVNSNSTTSVMVSTFSGNSKDSTITAVRIG